GAWGASAAWAGIFNPQINTDSTDQSVNPVSICVHPCRSVAALSSQRIYDLPTLIFAERLERLGADISLRTESEHTSGVSLVIRSFDYADEIVAAHRQKSLFDLHSGFLEAFLAGVEPGRTTFDCRDRKST